MRKVVQRYNSQLNHPPRSLDLAPSGNRVSPQLKKVLSFLSMNRLWKAWFTEQDRIFIFKTARNVGDWLL